MGPEDHGLPPDNFQETPEPRVAHRTSPTNIGMGLLATLAAHDLGFIGAEDLLRRERLKTAIGELDTVVYRSARSGSGRETLFWYAPTLGYALVRAEQHRDGKRAFRTTIRRYQQG